MSIFYLIFIVLAVYFSIRYDGIEEYNSHKQHRLWLMCAYMICMTGFSYGLGGDKFAYMDEFEYYSANPSDIWRLVAANYMIRGQMPLWTVLNVTCKSLFDSFYAIQLIESAAINIAVCYVVSKNTHRYFLFLLIYFFSLKYFIFNCEVMREGFAIAFMLFGMQGLKDNRYGRFVVTFIFAILFHVSAAIALLFPFVKFKLSWKMLLYSAVIALVLWSVSDLIMGKVFGLSFAVKGAFAQKAMAYSLKTSSFFGFIVHVFTYLVFPFIAMYYIARIETSEKERAWKEKLVSYMVVLAVIAVSSSPLARFYNYVQVFYMIMLADFVYVLFRTSEHLILRLATCVCTFVLMFMPYFAHYETTNTRHYEFFYPYTCILSEDESVYFRVAAHNEATSKINESNVREIE